MPQTIVMQAQRFTSVERAQHKASFRIMVPSDLPEDMDLAFIQYWVLPGKEDDPLGADSITMFYTNADESQTIRIDQGNTGRPLPPKDWPIDATGEISINGKDGLWMDGFPSMPWRPGLISVGWDVSDDYNERLPRSYTVTSTALGLDRLLEIARSVE